MSMKKYAVIFFALFIFLAPAVSAVEQPTAAIKVTVDRIFSILKDKSLAGDAQRGQRRALIMAEVGKRFDFVEMSMRAMGRSWRERSRAEKDEFVGLFSELLKKTYIRRIEAYSGEVVEFRKVINRAGRAMVYSVVVRGDGKEIPINYAMKVKDGSWQVYDVVIEGVSLVRNYRTEFTRVLGREKYAGLLKRLRAKVDELAREDQAGNG